MAKKIRKIGSASDSPPPAGAPKWVLNPVENGMYNYKYIIS